MADQVPTRDDMKRALHKLRNTAPGADKLRARLYQQNQDLQEALFRLVDHCWSTGTVPREWQTAVLIALPKKADAQAWTEFRGITLLVTASKLLTMLIFLRAAPPLREEQFGFRRARSTNQPIAVAKNLMALHREGRSGTSMVLTFVDAEKAYDRLYREGAWGERASTISFRSTGSGRTRCGSYPHCTTTLCRFPSTTTLHAAACRPLRRHEG